jgi:hypothetical protein
MDTFSVLAAVALAQLLSPHVGNFGETRSAHHA